MCFFDADCPIARFYKARSSGGLYYYCKERKVQFELEFNIYLEFFPEQDKEF